MRRWWKKVWPILAVGLLAGVLLFELHTLYAAWKSHSVFVPFRLRWLGADQAGVIHYVSNPIGFWCAILIDVAGVLIFGVLLIVLFLENRRFNRISRRRETQPQFDNAVRRPNSER